ncbi:MAG: exosortase/archaeosortase family protein [Bacteroidia bacterium]|nr:MAG: exosortase/archaeosortase family protein [Bacteroidia bacterium]
MTSSRPSDTAEREKTRNKVLGKINFSDPRIKFVLVASVIYFLSFVVYELILKKYTLFDEYVIRVIIENTDEILKRMGFKTFKTTDVNDFQVIGIHGSVGVWVGKACDAVSLFIIFLVFVLAFPGRQRDKWWFVPFGILTIYLMNVLRVAALTIITYYAPEWLEFNHTYVFTFLVYAYIFLLWIWWVNKYA